MSFRLSLSRKIIDEACNKYHDVIALLDQIDDSTFIREFSHKPKPSMTTNTMLTIQELQEIWRWIPLRFRIANLSMLFSTQTDGYSLKSFYNKCGDASPTLILLKTKKGAIFGAFASHPWSERQGLKAYFGSGETFVFSLRPTPVKYAWSGIACFGGAAIDEYFLMGGDHALVIGGGG